MSIEKDIDIILSLTPTLREPTSEQLTAARRRFRKEPARRLREMRRILEELALARPNPKWEETQAKVTKELDEFLAKFMPEWQVLNVQAGDFLKSIRAA